jgi:transcriptional regulator of acetoin/glycerol metabolism
MTSASTRHTTTDGDRDPGRDDAPAPGIVVVWRCDAPVLESFRIGSGLVLGRPLFGDHDDRLSRLHARVWVRDGAVHVADLGSRNGTLVDGTPIGDREVRVVPGGVIRTGHTIAIAVADARLYEGAVLGGGDAVVGPVLARAWRAIETAARIGGSLLITGESGVGKELAARRFHAASGAGGELIAINAAAVPASVAERLLFGTRRGAFSGADRDADGYLAAAHGGTLFLDELAELDLEVQGKLLRVIETGEVLPLGAVRPQQARFRVVAATHAELGAAVAAGRFRADLYYRIGRPEVVLPPLRARRDEIAHLIARAAEGAGIEVHPSFVEACLVRPWPGNVRELVGEVRHAARAAHEAGDERLHARALPERAGVALAPSTEPAPAAARGAAVLPGLDAIREALRATAGNVTAAARRLAIHRNQLRRLIVHHPELAAGHD